MQLFTQLIVLLFLAGKGTADHLQVANMLASLSKHTNNLEAFLLDPNPNLHLRTETADSWKVFANNFAHYVDNAAVPNSPELSTKPATPAVRKVATPAVRKVATPAVRKVANTDGMLLGIRLKQPGQIHMDNGKIGEVKGVFAVDYDESQITGNIEVVGDMLMRNSSKISIGGVSLNASQLQDIIAYVASDDHTITGNIKVVGDMSMSNLSKISIGDVSLNASQLQDILAYVASDDDASINDDEIIVLTETATASSSHITTSSWYANNDNDNYKGWKMFDQNFDGSHWATKLTANTWYGSTTLQDGGVIAGEWATYYFEAGPVTVTSYRFRPYPGWSAPEHYLVVSDSNAQGDWQVIDHRTFDWATEDGSQTMTFVVDTRISGCYIRFIVTSVYNGASCVDTRELELSGVVN